MTGNFVFTGKRIEGVKCLINGDRLQPLSVYGGPAFLPFVSTGAKLS